MSDETLELLWSMLTNEQLLELREKGAMDDRTMASFKTELFKRCLIQFDETADAVGQLEDLRCDREEFAAWHDKSRKHRRVWMGSGHTGNAKSDE